MGSSLFPFLHKRRKDLTWSDLFVILVVIGIWGTMIYICVDMAMEYWREGRKEKTGIKQSTVDFLEAPWISLLTGTDDTCYWAVYNCTFTRFVDAEVTQCMTATEYHTFSLVSSTVNAAVANSTKMRDLGVVFYNQLDLLALSFALVVNDSSRGFPLAKSAEECGFSSVMGNFLPIGDDNAMNKVRDGTANVRDLGTPMYVAQDHVATVSFSLSQEKFIGGKVVNTTSFTAMQFRRQQLLRPVVLIEIMLSAASFSVPMVEHAKGESMKALLGGMFGWVGILTGACIQGVILSSFSTMQKYQRRVARRQQRAAQCGKAEPLAVPLSEKPDEVSQTPTQGSSRSSRSSSGVGGACCGSNADLRATLALLESGCCPLARVLKEGCPHCPPTCCPLEGCSRRTAVRVLASAAPLPRQGFAPSWVGAGAAKAAAPRRFRTSVGRWRAGRRATVACEGCVGGRAGRRREPTLNVSTLPRAVVFIRRWLSPQEQGVLLRFQRSARGDEEPEASGGWSSKGGFSAAAGSGRCGVS